MTVKHACPPRCHSFATFDEYEAWRTEHDLVDQAVLALSPEDRFWLTAALSDAVARLSATVPQPLAATFDSFEAYETWRDERPDPWNW